MDGLIMAGGRPRTVSFTPDEMIELGEEMVEWVTLNDPLHLSQWYTIHKGFMYREWKTFIQKKEFLPYYEIALKIVGIKYLDGESKRVKEGISQRWQRTYFRDLVEREDEDADANAKRTATANRDALVGTPANDKDLTIFHENLRMKDKINELERQLGERNGCEHKAST